MANTPLPPEAPANDELGPNPSAKAMPAQNWPLNAQIQEQAEAWLIRLQSPSLPQAEEAQFFQWLESSPAHQAAYVQAEQLWSGLGSIDNLSELSQAPNTQANRSWLKPAMGFAMAASVALAVFIPQWLSPAQNFETNTGEQLQLSLADGSRVQLNTQSALAVQLENEQRLLELEHGEAYFDVQADPNRPFIVKTPGGYVRVLGTRFNIYSDGDETRVTVLEGKVDVSIGRELEELAQLDFSGNNHLIAEQQIRLEHLTSNNWLEAQFSDAPPARRGEITQVDGRDVLAWQRGEAVYNGVTLAAVINDLNRYYPGQIRLQDESIQHQAVVAVLPLNDKKAALTALADSFQLDVVELADGQVIFK